jgi:hypothetical protein
MTDFYAWVIAGSGKLNFHFTRIYIVRGVKFFVTVIDNRKKLLSFDMKMNEGGEWKLIPPIPLWIQEIEQELADAINRNF